MNTHTFTLSGTLLAGLLALTTTLQAAENPTRTPEGTVRPLAHPLMIALDGDRDGELSAEEIEQATVALKKMDRNQDGKLDRMELRLATRSSGTTRPLQGRGGDQTGSLFAQRIMRLDQDGNGKVTQDELPESMDRILERADTNKDGAIDQAEAQRFAAQFGGVNRREPAAQEKSPPPPEEQKEEQ